MIGSAWPAASSCRTRSRRPAAGWSTPTSGPPGRISRCSWARTGSATGVRGASASCWRRVPKHDAAEFAAMQVDVVSVFARQVLPTLLGHAGAGRRQPARRWPPLRDWDGAMRMDAPQPLIFNAWMRPFAGRALRQSGRRRRRTARRADADLVGQALAPAGRALCGGDCGPLLAASLAHGGGRAGGAARAVLGRGRLGQRASGGVRPSAARAGCRCWAST